MPRAGRSAQGAVIEATHDWYRPARFLAGLCLFVATAASAAVPAAPAGIQPQSLTFTSSPTFTWNPVTGATRYYLRVENAAAVIVNDVMHAQICTGTPCSYVPTAFARGSYSWFVRAENADGPGPWSTALFFTVTNSSVAPVPIRPDGVVSQPATFQWTPVTWAPPSMYWLELRDETGTNSYYQYTPANAACNASDCTVVLPVMTAGTYQWRVMAETSSGQTDWSDPRLAVLGAAAAGNFPAGCIVPQGNGWTNAPAGSTAGWLAATDFTSEGTCSLRSAPIESGGKAQIELTTTFDAGVVSFDRKVSSLPGYGCLRFLIDGVSQDLRGSCGAASGASGDAPMTRVMIPIAAGTHTLLWSYERYATAAAGFDSAWIDDLVVLPWASVPAIPTPVSPITPDAPFETTPTLQWSASAGATSYEFAVYNGSFRLGGATVSAAAAGCSAALTCSYSSGLVLARGTTYGWSVRALSPYWIGDWSPRALFAVNWSSGLQTPYASSPVNAVLLPDPDFVWYPVPSAQWYDIELTDLDTRGATPRVVSFAAAQVCTVSECRTKISPAPTPGVQYTWKIRARNSAYTGDYGDAPTPFKIILATVVPATPTTLEPSGILTTATPAYSWNWLPEIHRVLSYNLRVEDAAGVVVVSQSFSPGVCGIGGTCTGIPSVRLTDGATYTWSVSATNYAGTSAWSPPRTITINELVPPSLVSPAGTIATNVPTYTWSAVAHATGYWLLVWGPGPGGGAPVPVPVDLLLDPASAGCPGNTGSCSVTPAIPLANGVTYGWSVGATGVGVSGFSGSSAPGSFTVSLAGAVPAVPTQIGPTGTFTSSQNPTYSWNAVAGATRYWLRLTNGSGGVWTDRNVDAATAGCAAGTGTCSFRPGAPVPNNTSWTWVVSASNANGMSAFSAGLPITVAAPPPNLPAVPTQIGPSGTFTSSQNPTYSWNAVSGATGYWLKLTNATGGVWTDRAVTATDAGCAAGTGTCSFRPGAPVPNNTSWTWFVASTNANGQSAFSAGLPITVAVSFGPLPAVPTQIGPTGTFTSSQNPTYSWNAVSGATGYWLKLTNATGGVWTDRAVTAADAGCAVGTGTCSFRPGAPVPNNTSWTWFVASTNASGQSAFSAGMPITVAVPATPPAVPASPTQIGPSGTFTSSQNPTYFWNAVSGATGYWLKLQNSSGGVWTDRAVTAADAGCAAGTGTCSFRPGAPVPNFTSWMWFVASTNANGQSAFSAGMPITVAVSAAIPSTPAQVGPTGTLTLTFNPTYVWAASPGATSYWLLLQNSGGVWTDRAVTPAEAGCSSGTGNCSFTPGAGIPNDTSWTWVVNASNDNGASPFSAGLPIMVSVPHLAPNAPTLIAPVGVAYTNPTYSWNASAGASSYTLLVQNTSSTPVNVAVTAKNAGCPSGTGVCTFTPTTPVGFPGPWDWSVSATNIYGASPFSAPSTFGVALP